MEIKSTTTIKFDKDERDKLLDAAQVLDDVYAKDLSSALQFDVGGLSLVDPDDMATMIRTLITLSDTGNDIKGDLEL